MYPWGFAVAGKQSWYSQWKMSSSFMPLIVSNDDGFYILSMESMLWKKLDYANLCMYVFIYCNRWSDQESNEKSQTNLTIFPAHPRTSFLSVVFFPSNYSDDITQISSWEPSSQHRRQTHGKTFAGSGVMAVRRVPPRTGKVLAQPGGQNTWDLGNLLGSLQLQDPWKMLFFVSLFFVDHNLTAA